MRGLSIVGVLSILTWEPAHAEWKSLPFRDTWFLNQCKADPLSSLPINLRANLKLPPITIPLPNGKVIKIPASGCPSDEQRRQISEKDLIDATQSQVRAIDVLNKAYNGKIDVASTSVRRFIYSFETAELAKLYAAHTCETSEPCVKSARMDDSGSISNGSELARTDDKGPTLVYAIRIEYYDLDIAMTAVRQAFAAYRARANIPDQNEWSLSPLYGYPADIIPFAVADCGAVGRTYKSQRAIFDNKHRIIDLEPFDAKMNVAIIFSAHINDLGTTAKPLVADSKDQTQVMNFVSVQGCATDPKSSDELLFLSAALKELQQ